MNLRRILIVEDDAIDVELMQRALEAARIANPTDVVGDGVEALEYLRCTGAFAGRPPESPAVVLLDLKMPRMDGLETLAAIRADAALKAQPVVMVTSSREERDLVASYNLGTNAYVVKPVDFDEFSRAIGAIGLFWAVVNESLRR